MRVALGETETDWYRVLQVDPDADLEVITAAYYQLASRSHPDVDPSPRATARMRELNAAWAVLRNPERRAAYDRRRAGAGLGGRVARGRSKMRLELPSSGVLDFADPGLKRGADQVCLGIVNEGTAPLVGRVAGAPGWLSIWPAQFVVAPGQRVPLAVHLHRERIPYPSNGGATLRLLTSEGERVVPVAARYDPTGHAKAVFVVLMVLAIALAVSLQQLALVPSIW